MSRNSKPVLVQAKPGEQITLAEKFSNSVCMIARVGLYFHAPLDYPKGELGGWQRVCWLPIEAGWAWILQVAADVQYNNYSLEIVKRKSGTGRREAPTFGELRDQDPLQLICREMAIVVQVTEKEIIAVYYDPHPPKAAPFPFCLIRLRP